MTTMETIESAKYEGYLWRSDQPEPEVFMGDKPVGEITLSDDDNPFVVEGNLWDAATRRSVTIRYVDGHYRVRRTEVTPDELAGIKDAGLDPLAGELVATTKKEYIAHRIPGVKSLRYLQYWKGEADELCAGFKALRPEKLVFVGLKK